MDTPNDTLVCTKCGNAYPATLEHFKRDNKKRNGLFSWCRTCSNADSKRRYSLNIEANRAKALQRRNANIERARETTREYHRTHREEDREQSRRWYKANPNYKANKKNQAREHYSRDRDKILARAKKYHANHPEANRVARFRRKAREKRLPDAFTTADWLFALDYFDYRCAVCGRTADLWTALAADHWIPLTSTDCPGTIPANIVPLCHSKPGAPAGLLGCNQSKFTSNAAEWLVRRFGGKEAQRILGRVTQYLALLNQDHS